ncbi:MAG: exodeoxyribonuclease VII small subunit [Firmicutes bacterium]|nr:exodeoxyribonuclease VII small subunit [Bacillota bacterium]
MPRKKQTFEEAVNRLEEVVAEMEDSKTSLDRSMALYKEGVTLVMRCAEDLSGAEKEITALQRTAEGIFTQKPFESGGEA